MTGYRGTDQRSCQSGVVVSRLQERCSLRAVGRMRTLSAFGTGYRKHYVHWFRDVAGCNVCGNLPLHPSRGATPRDTRAIVIALSSASYSICQTKRREIQNVKTADNWHHSHERGSALGEDPGWRHHGVCRTLQGAHLAVPWACTTKANVNLSRQASNYSVQGMICSPCILSPITRGWLGRVLIRGMMHLQPKLCEMTRIRWLGWLG